MPHLPEYPEIVADLAALAGISRPAGQCFAAIWRAARPPCADDLSAALHLSRSNVSTALKELRDWGLIARARAPGDRKDYFTAPPDAWDIVRAVMTGRQRRAVAPLVDRLTAAGAETGDSRLTALRDVLAAMSARMEMLAGLDAAGLSAAFGEGTAGAGDDDQAPGRKKKKKKRG